MKPFDLERALAGDPVITRNGLPVTQFVLFKDTNHSYNLHGVLEKCVVSFTENGLFYQGGIHSKNDLFMAPKTQKLWIAISKEISLLPDRMTSYATSCAYENIEKLKNVGHYADETKWRYVQVEIEE